jgi:hypothetical protein
MDVEGVATWNAWHGDFEPDGSRYFLKQEISAHSFMWMMWWQ